MKLSVAMGTYNGAVHLPEQLASIAAQTRPADELIICDDCSSDETRALIETFARHTPVPVRLHVNQQNLGSTKNFEKAIGLCAGDVIALCDQDDVWRSDKLQMIEESLLKSPAAGLVFSDAEIVDTDLKPIGRRMWTQVGFDHEQRRLIRNGRSLDVLIPGWTVTGATIAFRSEYRSLFLPIPTEIAMIHDGWIALAIASVAEVILLEEPLVNYRQHSWQQIGAPGDTLEPARFKQLGIALRRATRYADLRMTLSTLRQRLSAHRDSFDCRNAFSTIENYSGHIEARSNLPAGKLKRLPAILRELKRLRYHRFSRGFRSAAKDLVS
jgi:glycosyltransferase involved in cell wall biosynthesis